MRADICETVATASLTQHRAERPADGEGVGAERAVPPVALTNLCKLAIIMQNCPKEWVWSICREVSSRFCSGQTREFPAVVITGARQAGKTTLLKHLFGDRYRYLSLETPDVLAAVQADPRGFLQLYAPPVILDEVQNAPELLPYIKEDIDSHRERKGQYILSGSQNLLMMQRVSETLAGRCAVLQLMPFSFAERRGQPQTEFIWEREPSAQPAAFSIAQWWQWFLRGSYPEIALDEQRDFTLWYASYVQTYLERDVRAIRQVGDLITYQAFLRILAARSGQLLNLSDVSRELGVAVNTAKAWLSVLEATHQVIVLRHTTRTSANGW
jgi:predicted AAA+ superfamily ATPase